MTLLTTVLQENSSNAIIQTYGLRALGSMASNASTIEAIINVGSSSLAFTALRNFADSTSVCDEALTLLNNLSPYDGKGVSIEAGEIQTVVNSIKCHVPPRVLISFCILR